MPQNLQKTQNKTKNEIKFKKMKQKQNKKA